MEIFLLILIALLAGILFYLIYKYNRALASEKKYSSEKQSEIENLNGEKAKLESRISELNKYQHIVDITKEAEYILETTNNQAASIISASTEESSKIVEEANRNLDKSKEQSKMLIEQAQKRIDQSVLESSRIIKEAEEKAREIAGETYDAMKNAEEYERIVKAMKNIIEGYGDEYLKPTFSLLDDLAEEFSHTDGGHNLKIARDRNNSMVINGLAASCEYVENNRRKTAINFVLDAFNGKVDSILSKVKKDNYGTLEQKIKDAFSVVNNNGRAFRDARITEEYLQSRLDELKWAVIVQELKWQEREEQRIIREQIREEEKARREYEKAIKEAEKEERLLRKLIQKAQEEVAKANEEERVLYIKQLQELELKLIAAEEKNKRAISMAQQTKAGNVYIISNIGSFGEDVFKIGMTRRLEPLDRVRELGDASVPFEFDVHAMIYCDNAPQLERDLHKRFLKLQVNKVNPRKEFFKVNLSDIKNAIEELGLSVKWTLAAEARQYRESLAIESAIRRDKQLEQEWEQYQSEIDPVVEEELEINE